MIYNLFFKKLNNFPNKIFLIDHRQKLSYKNAWIEIQKYYYFYKRNNIKKVYFYANDSIYLIMALLAADQLGIEACILNREFALNEIITTIKRIGEGTLLTDKNLSNLNEVEYFFFEEINKDIPNYSLNMSNKIIKNEANNGKIIILTTGTTGISKAVLYTWDRLISQGHLTHKENARWLLVYPLNHFAGIQLLVHTLLNNDCLVIPKSKEIGDLIECIVKNKINSISATPTFWRFFLGKLKKEQIKQFSLQHITLGGEATDISILQRLQQLFPNASISQVYATTELGSCFSVSDSLPGFPKEYLNRPVGNVELKIVDGELFIKSEKKMIGYLNKNIKTIKHDKWIATGDLVEIVDDRVLFRGRKNDIINVGGVKVFPLKIEEEILKITGVESIRVYGKKNPITGQIVCADIEIKKEYNLDFIKEEIQKVCRTNLTRYEQPRIINFVDKIKKINEKIIRR